MFSALLFQPGKHTYLMSRELSQTVIIARILFFRTILLSSSTKEENPKQSLNIYTVFADRSDTVCKLHSGPPQAVVEAC